jgi:hypothetical protein
LRIGTIATPKVSQRVVDTVRGKLVPILSIGIAGAVGIEGIPTKLSMVVPIGVIECHPIPIGVIGTILIVGAPSEYWGGEEKNGAEQNECFHD